MSKCSVCGNSVVQGMTFCSSGCYLIREKEEAGVQIGICVKCRQNFDPDKGCACEKKKHTKQKHYTQFKIQPMEFIGRNKLGFLEGNIVKYICRYNLKNGVEDLKKAQHYLEKLIEREEKGSITL